MASEKPESNKILTSWPMSAKRKDKLRQHRTSFVDNLEVDDVLDELIQEGVITLNEKERIGNCHNRTRKDRAGCLLDLIARKDDNAYDIFVEVLGKQYKHLQSLLRERRVSFNRECSSQMRFNEMADIHHYTVFTPDYIKSIPYLGEPGAQNPTVVLLNDLEVPKAHSLEQLLSENGTTDREQLRKGTILILDTPNTEAYKDSLRGDNIIGVTYYGKYVLVDKKDCIDYGDPKDEPWYYPMEISPRQATLILLRAVNEKGGFLIYRSLHREPHVPYNIALRDSCGEVKHYHIESNTNSAYSVDQTTWFMTVKELVENYREAPHRLECRLGRCPSDTLVPLTPDIHFPECVNIDHKEIQLGVVIGSNEFGRFYKATWGLSKTTNVVVKTCELTLEFPKISEFLDEGRLLSTTLKGQNIIELFGISIGPKFVCMIQNFMKQGSLFHCLKERVVSGENYERNIDIFKQIVQALQHLEKQHYIIHRDIRAKNILLDEHMQVRVANFNFARKVSEDHYVPENDDKVTIRWSSPEILQRREYSTRSDIWAAGMVLWEMLSNGQKPYYERDKLADVIGAIGKGDVPERPESCPEEIYTALVLPCWKKECQDRPTADELLMNIKKTESMFASYHFPSYHNIRRKRDNPQRMPLYHVYEEVGDLSFAYEEAVTHL